MNDATVATWRPLGALDEFTEGEPAARVIEGRPVAVFRLGDALHALHDLCTHGHARLSDGFVEGDCVECPLHQGLIDIRSGAPRCAPVTEAVRVYPVRITDGRADIDVG
ncbi:non-heme iron oxygenase ferredoxin subunit [Burkholderia sp. FERM BP-3421]|jgi:anthranilate 1,2-dioxygenase ferredoxin component|uniref:anthranilate 1,2-dioxygenase ferredoxin subunit AndAb n=1 Tax=Burkholderia sp. FERM BP-3421 TaxID=1494466 RepID=UPI00235FBF8D|nr:anthranilate 1,2-dioxygenase ferredoxin subunit AndAb [Burkholderia sp. FERM BP-3421]WDD93006.1 non-heme iron oxygenase ferredoxin subunit [Burkholderia sp. FERM BP-3421]